MDYANYWASAVATADLGETIEQSLRFRGGISGSGNGGFLSKTITTSSTTAALTISFWVKLGNIPSGYNRMIFSSGTAGTASGNISYDMASSEAYIRFQDTSSYTAFTTQKLRDFSAWYHIVYRFDAANQYVKIYVNGSEHSSTSIATSARTSYGATSPMQIGRYADSGYPNNYWDGYLAEWNMLFGTSLGPDSFGRTNEDGVWVPKSLSDLTSNQYGALGNRLVFDSSAGLGDDTAPTGGTHASANDFTASGFDTGDVALYSAKLVSSTGSFFAASTNASKAFDGSTGTYAQTSTQYGTTLTFTPATAIAYSSQVEVYSITTGNCSLNGGSGVAFAANAYTQIVSGSGSITSMVFDGNYGGSITAIRVDGTILVDNTENDVDYFDTPTSNYATLNPLVASSSATFSNANLTYAASTTLSDYAVGTMAMKDKCYWETEIIAGTNIGVGIGEITDTSADSYLGGTGGDTHGYGFNGQILTGAVASSTQATYTTGDIIGQAYDPETGKWWVAKNGTWQNSGDPASGSGQVATVASASRTIMTPGINPYSSTHRINYGQMPFLYTAPTGFKALQTNNLPEPTIKNGSDHFRAIIGPGQGAAAGIANALLGDFASNCFFSAAGSTVDFGTTAAFTSGSSRANGFDGDLTTIMSSGPANSGIVFRPDIAISATSKVEIYYAPAGNITQEIYVNSSLVDSFTSSTAGWRDISSSLTFPLNIKNMAFKGTGSFAGGYVAAIRVDDEILRDGSILGLAQTAFPNGLWWIKDRANANQHQLVDSVRGSNSALNCPNLTVATYSAPSGNSVAWCWNVGGAAAENTDGTLTAQVAANTDAGFSIISWTGTGVAGTVGHGLTETPEFVINKNSVNATSGAFYAWHTGIPATQYLAPGSGATAATSSAVWNNTAPTDSVISLGTAGNGSDGPGRIMYAWHSVPGYSAFGTYTGNGNADGPFIYTGMRSAFVMIKRTDSNGNWYVWDTTRDPNNDCFHHLIPDANNSENTNSGHSNQIDIVSNGFKLRRNGGNTNANNANYIYACFAENPFGGENAPPATAR